MYSDHIVSFFSRDHSTFEYCCDDVPVSGRTAETCNGINLKASVFTIYQLWFYILVYRQLHSDNITRWFFLRKYYMFVVSVVTL
jgi:hypothetical protein